MKISIKKLGILVPLLAFSAMPAQADGFKYEVGYTTVSGDDSDISVDLGGLYGSVGYEWNHAANYSSGAEFLLAFGIQDDTLFDVKVDLEPSYEFAYRGTWATSTPDLSFFWRASYARVEFKASGFGLSESADETGFGLGIGGTWRGFTLGYTQYLGDLDDVSRVNIGYRF